MTNQAISLVVVFSLGYFGRRFHIFDQADSKTLTKIIIYFTIPALIFLSISNVQIQIKDIFILPFIAIVIPLVLLVFAILASSCIKLPPRTRAVFLCSVTIANLGFFLYPFFYLLYGSEGLSILAIFDIGNTLLAYSVTLYIALHFSHSTSPSNWEKLIEIIKFPPLWAIALAIAYALLSKAIAIQLPVFLENVLEIVGQSNSFLAMLTLGIHFRLRIQYPFATVLAVVIRMVGGGVLGVLIANLLGLEGFSRLVVMIAPGMPVGLTNIVYAVQYDLDAEFASSLVTLSLIIGFVAMSVVSFL